jgi:hypothetical protein
MHVDRNFIVRKDYLKIQLRHIFLRIRRYFCCTIPRLRSETLTPASKLAGDPETRGTRL